MKNSISRSTLVLRVPLPEGVSGNQVRQDFRDGWRTSPEDFIAEALEQTAEEARIARMFRERNGCDVHLSIHKDHVRRAIVNTTASR